MKYAVNSSRDVFTSDRLFSSTRFLFSRAEHDPMTIGTTRQCGRLHVKKTHRQTNKRDQTAIVQQPQWVY